MNDEVNPVAILHDLVKRTGVRKLLEPKVRKTLYQIAQDERRQSHKLLLEVEREIIGMIKQQCGKDFGDWLFQHWEGLRDTARLGLFEFGWPSGESPTATYHYAKILIEHSFRDLVYKDMKGPSYIEWHVSPFKAWVEYLAKQFEIDGEVVKRRICDAQIDFRDGSDFSRTYDRWLDGANISKMPNGHRALVHIATAIPPDAIASEEIAKLDHLTSWLLLSVGLQTISRRERSALAQPRPFESNFINLRWPSHKTNSIKETNEACRFIGEVTIPYQDGNFEVKELESRLDDWEQAAVVNPKIRVQYARLRARIFRARGEDARSLYEDVVKQSSQLGLIDDEHHGCLLEALGYCYQFGLEHKFKNIWDIARKSYLFTEMEENPSQDELEFIGQYGKVDPRMLKLAVIYEN